MKKKQDDYKVIPFPKMRRLVIDAGRMGHRKHIIHGLVEVDVTKARQHIREHKARTGESLSFTAFVITCLGRAVDENKTMHAYRNWRNQLVLFDEVDVNILIEREIDGQKMGIVHIIRAVNRRNFREIHQEIRAAQVEDVEKVTEVKGKKWFWQWFLSLPTFIRGFFWWALKKFPHLVKKHAGTVVVTAVGMFGKGGGWGIPQGHYTLTITLGGIAEKPGVIDGRIEIREYLSMTISVDHDIIDGAPAARFTQRLKELIESGYGLNKDLP